MCAEQLSKHGFYLGKRQNFRTKLVRDADSDRNIDIRDQYYKIRMVLLAIRSIFEIMNL
jgi:hypothetical protein